MESIFKVSDIDKLIVKAVLVAICAWIMAIAKSALIPKSNNSVLIFISLNPLFFISLTRPKNGLMSSGEPWGC